MTISKLNTIKLENKFHRNEHQILLKFDYDQHIISLVKTIPNAKWSYTLKAWYIKHNSEHFKMLKTTFKGKANLNFNNFSSKPRQKEKTQLKKKRILSEENKTLLNNFYKYLKGKRYSESTITSYTQLVADFISYYNEKEIQSLTSKDVERFLENVYIKQRYSISSQRLFISGINAFAQFYPEIKIKKIDLTRPKRSKSLPNVLSQEEIINLIRITSNLKHRAIIALIYSCGLRISELINLELRDIDINRLQLIVKNGKGRKDRYIVLANSYLPLLKNYLVTYEPLHYFVEGQAGEKYSAVSVRQFLKKWCKKAGIIKNVSPHTLRHSYATHMLENGIDIRYIQELLGHSKPETTMIYTRVAKKDLLKIKSPLDIAVKRMMDSGYNPHKVSITGI